MVRWESSEKFVELRQNDPSTNYSCSPCIVTIIIYYTLRKCLNQSFQEFLLIIMQLSIGKMIKINKFQNRFPKPKTEFRFKNRISGFQLTSLLATQSKLSAKLKRILLARWHSLKRSFQVNRTSSLHRTISDYEIFHHCVEDISQERLIIMM